MPVWEGFIGHCLELGLSMMIYFGPTLALVRPINPDEIAQPNETQVELVVFLEHMVVML